MFKVYFFQSRSPSCRLKLETNTNVWGKFTAGIAINSCMIFTKPCVKRRRYQCTWNPPFFASHTKPYLCFYYCLRTRRYISGLSAPIHRYGWGKREENALTRTHTFWCFPLSRHSAVCLNSLHPLNFLFASNLWVIQVENSTICTLLTRFEYGSGASCEQKQFSASTVRRQRLLFVSPFYSVKKP